MIGPGYNINWNPDTREELAQCVAFLLATAPGTVPLARDMGAGIEIDSPRPYVAGKVRAAVVRTLKQYEPRAEVARVEVRRVGNAGLEARVEIK